MGRGIKDAKLKFSNINRKEAVQYVALNFSREEIAKEGLTQVIPTKQPGTNIRLAAREGDQSGLFNYTNVRDVTDDDLTMVMGMIISKITHVNMSNHFYTFQGNVYKQSKGGAIGSELTGEVSRLYMLLWDRKFLNKLKHLGIHTKLYVRYVDDTLIVTESFRAEYRFSRCKWV